VKTIVSVSDFHIHDDSRLQKIEGFTREMDVLRPDIIVFLGDIGDPWETTWDKIRNIQSWKVLGELGLRRREQGLNTVWINRNHDYSAKRGYLSGVRRHHAPAV
jgi:predicted MPP superfamily phosphohydrolase